MFIFADMFGLFSKKKNNYQQGSLSAEAWRRLKKDKAAMISLYFIIILTILSIFGYQISPDSSPDANNQILEINKKKPGFEVNMLKVRKNEPEKKQNIFSSLFGGKYNEYTYIPISSYHFDSTSILIEIYSGLDSIEGIKRKIPLVDVVYPVCDTCEISEKNGVIYYSDISGNKQTASVSRLKEIIEIENLIINKRFWLGTDTMGRDFFSRMIIGSRVSLSVGFISVIISLLLGILLGTIAGYYRGWVDNLVMWFINVIWSVPTLLLVIAITFALGKGFWQIFIAVGLTMWVEVARIVRGQVLSIREKEYVEASKALGFRNFRIISRHILPNVMAPVIVISAANFASAILLEAGLSFLGIGVQPPTPSWGSMIKDHYGYIVLDMAYLAIIPGICIALLVLAFMLLGNGLRDALDVRTVEKQ